MFAAIILSAGQHSWDSRERNADSNTQACCIQRVREEAALTL